LVYSSQNHLKRHTFSNSFFGGRVKIETIQIGEEVPEFSLETYNPATGDFDKVSLSKIKAAGKWTILFFYPADFTFV
jgi:hypothetical protein